MGLGEAEGLRSRLRFPLLSFLVCFPPLLPSCAHKEQETQVPTRPQRLPTGLVSLSVPRPHLSCGCAFLSPGLFLLHQRGWSLSSSSSLCSLQRSSTTGSPTSAMGWSWTRTAGAPRAVGSAASTALTASHATPPTAMAAPTRQASRLTPGSGNPERCLWTHPWRSRGSMRRSCPPAPGPATATPAYVVTAKVGLREMPRPQGQ